MLRTPSLALLAALALAPAVHAAEEAEPGYQGPGSDLWIEARLITIYSLNALINPFDIGVDAEDGVVTLTGEVDNEAEKILAADIAEGLDGVTRVEDRLQIAAGKEGEREANPLYRLVTDAETTTRVQMRLLWNDTTGGLSIDVDTQDGVVTLTGPVHTEEERQMAERLARRTEGVREVKNALRVAPEETLTREAREAAEDAAKTISDAWITARVAASLRFDATINHGRIDVSTQDGVVTLAGKVPYLFQKKGAAETAREISGVKSVDNRLEVTEWL
jgi:osmotically-inducible protein OsmY